MARALGIRFIAEDVESAEQLNFPSEQDCFSPADAGGGFERWVRAYDGSARSAAETGRTRRTAGNTSYFTGSALCIRQPATVCCAPTPNRRAPAH